ncbi:MAG: exodeoxyribonuclease VII small subunit [Planctomycetota bacterium]|nr:exodeoxyribonuclease VII small subunit [Planctomycetota bacterium]
MARSREETRGPEKPDADGGSDARSFEDALKELEEIAADLEEGGKPLEESLALYERGIKALRRCRGILSCAEEKIRLLLEKEGGPVLEDLPPGGLKGIRRGQGEGAGEEAPEESGDGEGAE